MPTWAIRMEKSSISRRGLFERLIAAWASLVDLRVPHENRAGAPTLGGLMRNEPLVPYSHDDLGRVVSVIHYHDPQ